MILYVNDRLVRWGEWVVRGRNEGRNGFPGQAAFVRLAGLTGERSAWSPMLDVEAEEVDQCIRRLTAERRALVIEYYSRTVTSVQLAKRLGCCEKTLFNRLTIIQNEILGMLNDLAAGIELPPVARVERIDCA